MKSKKKLIKQTTAVFGLAAVPTAAALGLSYGIRDEKINLSLAPANSFGERYFDNQIVKVKDDNFAAGVLYNPIERSDEYDKFSIENQKDADIAGLVRLDRKLDAKYARSVINIDDADTDQGKIDVDGGLVYDFNGIKQLITTKSGKNIFGKDIIKGMQEDAKAAITKAIYDFKIKNNSDSKDIIDKTQPLRMGIYFDKNVINRTVSIYLYELKDFDPEQDAAIHNFIKKIESKKIGQNTEWIKTFRYSVWNTPGVAPGEASKDYAYDRIDGLSNTIKLPDMWNLPNTKNEQTGFPEIFAGTNLMSIGVANNWFTLGGIDPEDQVGITVEKNGKIGIEDFKHRAYTDPAQFKADYDNLNLGMGKVPGVVSDKIIKRINDSKYISFDAKVGQPMLNFLESSTHGHEIGPIQFAEKGIVPLIQPIIDYKNKVLKIKYTFKAFRKLGSETTRSLGTFNMGDEIENPYEICTYIKEIPLTDPNGAFGMGNEGRDGTKARIKIGSSTGKHFQPFYVDDTTNIDPRKPEYDSLKASVVRAMKGNNGKTHTSSQIRIDNSEEINMTNAKAVLKEFLVTKTPAFSAIPIVGPGMGILSQMIPAIAASVQSWMDIGTMTAADPTITDIYDQPGFMDTLIDIINQDDMLNPTEFINTINAFTKEAWSDLTSLINLSGKVLNGERTSRTFQLFHMLAAFNDISETIFDSIKANHPDAYMGNSTSVIDQLMAWLKKNGIIDSGDSLMDIIDNYKDRLGTIVESIGINRPNMEPQLISSLVDLIPLPLFSQKGSEFNRDAAAIIEALLNGKYIKPVAIEDRDDKHHVDTYDRNLPAIIELLNGNGRTSVQTFFKHILNDNSKDLMKFILGVIGADYSKTDTFANAITALYTVFQAKVPKYEMIPDPSSSDPKDRIVRMQDVLDENGNPIINIDKSHKQEPVIEKDANGKDVMIVNPTFGGIGIALENMYVNGIHSIPKDSYESVFKFIFGTVGSLVDMGTLSEQQITEASEGLYHFISQGAGHIVNGASTSALTATDISGIIIAVNAIANKEVISPALGTFIFDIMEKGVGSLTIDNIKPIITLLRPTLDGAGIGKGLTDEQIATTFNHLFTGFKGTGEEVSKELAALVPALSTKVLGTSIADVIGQIINGKGYGLVATGLHSKTRDNLQKLLKDGLANMGDQDWVDFISNVKELLPLVSGSIDKDVFSKIDTLFNGDNTVKAFQGVGHLLRDGLVGVDYSDISTIINVINSLKLSFSIPDEQVLPISLLAQNILRNGVDASPKDIQTIIKLVQTFAGSSVSNIIETINGGNPEQEKDPDKLEQMYTGEAFSRLMMDFIVGNKYDGKEGLYAKDRIGSIVLPEEVHLATDPVTHKQLAQRPGSSMSIADPDHKGQTIIVDNPEYWEFGTYAKLASQFAVLKQEIISGHAFGDGSYNGKELTSDELSEKLAQAQMIPAQIAKLNSKVDVANAKVQIYIDALEAFKTAHDQMDAVIEVTPSSTLTGDNADYAKSIDALFKLMKSKMLAASSEATFLSLHGGYDSDNKYISQTGTITINENKALYLATKRHLDDLNSLLTELYGGKVGSDFLTRMTKIFTDINSSYSNKGVKGILPGLPPALKTLFDKFVASNTIGSDSDGKASWTETIKGTWPWSPSKTVNHLKGPSSALVAFKKFISDNWEELFGNAGIIGNSNTGWQIIPHFGSDWHNPLKSIPESMNSMVQLSDAIYSYIKSPAEQKLFKQLVDEFKKHIS